MPRHPERHVDPPRRPTGSARGFLRGPRRAAAVAVGVLAGSLLLSACAAPETAPAPVETVAPTPTATASAQPVEPAGPVLVPEGTAQQNLPLFAEVVAAVWATPQQVTGQAYIDALVAAGFDKSAMQLTPDQSTVGNPAETIQFSVRWGQECLVGQVGPATGAPVSAVVPILGEGNCLVGDTRPIDW